MKCILHSDIRKGVLNKTVEDYSVAVATVLYDKLGMDEETAANTLEQIQYIFDSINRGYVDIYDLKKVLSEEHGVTFVRTKK